MTRVSIIAPVYNEVQFIGYSVMAAMPHVEEFVYAISPKSNDGTIELLRHIAKRYGHLGGKVRLMIDSRYDFDPMDTQAYNRSFNDCIEQARGEAVFFLHPDMVVTKWTNLNDGPLAWWTNVTSYAGDFSTVITKGRCDKWKNIHAKKFGLHYFGAYGSTNEDFYHSQITGTSYRHFGTEFTKYPFEVADSGISINHYCEVKPYQRRLEKMRLCLQTQNPTASKEWIDERASQHPRVTLEQSCDRFGNFEFTESKNPIPEIIRKYQPEFEQFQNIKELIHG